MQRYTIIGVACIVVAALTILWGFSVPYSEHPPSYLISLPLSIGFQMLVWPWMQRGRFKPIYTNPTPDRSSDDYRLFIYHWGRDPEERQRAFRRRLMIMSIPLLIAAGAWGLISLVWPDGSQVIALVVLFVGGTASIAYLNKQQKRNLAAYWDQSTDAAS